MLGVRNRLSTYEVVIPSVSLRTFSKQSNEYKRTINTEEKEIEEKVFEEEMRPYIHSYEQIAMLDPNLTPSIKSLENDLLGFEESSQYSAERLYTILTNATWASIKEDIAHLKGFKRFYLELKSFLENNVIDH
jgi:hypothetical protein